MEEMVDDRLEFWGLIFLGAAAIAFLAGCVGWRPETLAGVLYAFFLYATVRREVSQGKTLRQLWAEMFFDPSEESRGSADH